jgi:hypothetical protein
LWSDALSFEPIEEGLRSLLSPDRADGGVCSLDLYRYASGDATPEEAAAFEAHLTGCDACREDLDVFRGMTGAVEPGRPVPGWRPAWLAAAALLLCMLVAGLFVALRSGEPGPEFRIKGPFRIHMAVQRGERRFSASSGGTFRTGDVLGFFYTAPEDGYLVVLFSDQRGKITRVFPVREPGWVRAGIQRPLPDGAVLEPGEGCEWIVGFFSQKPSDVEELGEFLRRAVQDRKPDCTLGPMEPEGISIHALTLRREPS